MGGKDVQTWLGQALTVQRLEGTPPAPAGTLAAWVYGGDAAGTPLTGAPCCAGVPLQRLLSQQDRLTDFWLAHGPVEQGHTGRIRWARSGPWLWGALEAQAWDDSQACAPNTLAAEAEALYHELLAFLHHSRTPHLLRVWNYLPHITREDAGLERYRHFNLGRQKALLEAHSAAFEGSPAACALGTHTGPLCLRFLAGSAPALAIENPRQVSAYRYPADYGPASPSFSRAALLDAGGGQLALLISGTASVLGHATAHVGDWRAQLAETVRNLQAVISVANQRSDARFCLRECVCVVYVREAALAAEVQALFNTLVGPGSHAARTALYLHADVCRSDLLLEIEAHAWAPGKILG